jgi:DNA-binding LacI/PurR family transcriptional regulator
VAVTKQVQLRDVARHAGVSPATVSRIFNGNPRVDPELRDRVQASAEALGYRPNRLARSMRRQRVDAIGVVVSDIENPHFGTMINVIEHEAFERGFRLLVCATDESAKKQSTYLRMLEDERVAGVVISPSDPRVPELTSLLDASIPVVAFDREVADPRADTVIADNVLGLMQATQLLIDAGHSDIGFVGGRATVETGIERLHGYRQAMRAAGLKPRAVAGDFRIEGGQKAVAKLLMSPNPPSAVVVANNLMTLGALKAARDAGVTIPRDLALVGVDDPHWAEFVTPPITSLAQPVAAMAREAVDILMSRIEGDAGPPRRSMHSFGLIVRESCGTVRRSSRRTQS